MLSAVLPHPLSRGGGGACSLSQTAKAINQELGDRRGHLRWTGLQGWVLGLWTLLLSKSREVLFFTGGSLSQILDL